MVQEKEEEDRIRQYNESLQGRDREVKKKKVRRAPSLMRQNLSRRNPSILLLLWSRKDAEGSSVRDLTRRVCAHGCCGFVVLQEEKKAIQDAMIAKIVAEAKRKQAEEDEMRMVRGIIHKACPTAETLEHVL